MRNLVPQRVDYSKSRGKGSTDGSRTTEGEVMRRDSKTSCPKVFLKGFRNYDNPLPSSVPEDPDVQGLLLEPDI